MFLHNEKKTHFLVWLRAWIVIPNVVDLYGHVTISIVIVIFLQMIAKGSMNQMNAFFPHGYNKILLLFEPTLKSSLRIQLWSPILTYEWKEELAPSCNLIFASVYMFCNRRKRSNQHFKLGPIQFFIMHFNNSGWILIAVNVYVNYTTKKCSISNCKL